MNVKMTMKIGDHVEVMNNEQSKMFSADKQGFEQLLQGKGALTMLTNMIDSMDPSNVGKRIEMILEFDDGQYIVIGRKPKDDDDGR